MDGGVVCQDAVRPGIRLVGGARMEDAHSVVAIEQWGLFELELQGSSDGNPYVDIDLKAGFFQGPRSIRVTGFYDGAATYRVRFMPDTTGTWSYRTQSNNPALNGLEGAFNCVAASDGNHGPVRVANTYHF